jgi:hypothetical protein
VEQATARAIATAEEEADSFGNDRKKGKDKGNNRSRSFAPLRMTTRKTRATTATAWQQQLGHC